ncbi:hypothetical protein JCM10212_000989 [Sporobolomyces blumeae]
MAGSFVPYDLPPSFVEAPSNPPDCFCSSDDLATFPPDVISPIAGLSLYEHASTATSPVTSRWAPDHYASSLHRVGQPPPMSLPLPSDSSSSFFPTLAGIGSHAAYERPTGGNSFGQRYFVSGAVVEAPPTPLVSPGLGLSSVGPYSTNPSIPGVLLTPPLEVPSTAGFVPFDLLKRERLSPAAPPPSNIGADRFGGLPQPPGAHPSDYGRLASTFTPSPLPLTPPLDAPQPFLTTYGSSPSLQRAVADGLANRAARGLGNASLSPATSIHTLPTPQTAKPRNTAGGGHSLYIREEVPCVCATCSVAIATLHLRGKGDSLDTPYEAHFLCFDCRPDLADDADMYEGPDDVVVGYDSTLSAILDKAEGTLLIDRRRTASRPTVKVRKADAPRRDPTQDLLVCDVCRKDVGSGSLRPSQPSMQLDFGVEVVCVHCAALYRRCSDCGSGGGPRLGIGKWRCRELFDEGRRCCSLSHARMGSTRDLSYETHSISSIPPEELDEVSEACFKFFRTTLLAALATPDVLDAPWPIASSYDQVDRLAVDTWTYFEPFFRESSLRSRRRYIGLRWATPVARKKGKPARRAVDSPPMAVPLQHASTTLLRSGKKLTGFALMEVDLDEGLLYTPLTMPMGSVGETYDASTTLLQRLSQHISLDMDALSSVRYRQQLPPYPNIREAWTAVLFSKDTRGVNHLEARRSYIPVESTSSSGPSSAFNRFSARLSEVVPPEVQRGWTIFTRPYGGAFDDWGEFVKSRSRRRTTSKATGRKPSQVKGEDTDDGSDYTDDAGTIATNYSAGSTSRKRARR